MTDDNLRHREKILPTEKAQSLKMQVEAIKHQGARPGEDAQEAGKRSTQIVGDRNGIMGNLTGLFDTVNTRVGEIAVQVGTTPAAWNAGVFSLIRQLSETVILPIAGLILTFVATYELIQLIIEKNNLHDDVC